MQISFDRLQRFHTGGREFVGVQAMGVHIVLLAGDD
jgi:hypothetical protein